MACMHAIVYLNARVVGKRQTIETLIMHACRLTPNDFHDIISFINSHRTETIPFDMICMGKTSGQDPEKGAKKVEPYSDVGVTWWLEFIGTSAKIEKIRERINLGPPRA